MTFNARHNSYALTSFVLSRMIMKWACNTKSKVCAMCMHLVGQSHISDWCRCVGFGQATDEHIAKYNQYGFAVKNVQTEWMLHGEAATVKLVWNHLNKKKKNIMAIGNLGANHKFACCASENYRYRTRCTTSIECVHVHIERCWCSTISSTQRQHFSSFLSAFLSCRRMLSIQSYNFITS